MRLIKFVHIFALVGVLGVGRVSCSDHLTMKPPNLQSCQMDQPDLTECLTKNLQQLVVKFETGEMAGSIDPARFAKEEYRSRNFNISLCDIKLIGFKHTAIEEMRINPKDCGLTIKLFLPHVRMQSPKYEMEGIVKNMHLSGSGGMFVDIEKVTMVVVSTVHRYEEDGFTFFNVTRVSVELDVARIRSHFDNLSFGKKNNSNQSKILNAMVNSQWRKLFEAARPFIKDTLEHVGLRLHKKFFSHVPANFFIEDIPKPQ